VAQAYLENIWKYFALLEDVVSDWDRTFTGQFFTNLYDYLSIKGSMWTAYHPQCDRQTETINQIIESCLRSYCNDEQNIWATMLAMAEYAYYNAKHSVTKISPFNTNYGFEPRTNWARETQIRNPASELYGHYMAVVYSMLTKQLAQYIEVIKMYYDKKLKLIEPLKTGEWEMINGKNIRANTDARNWKIKCTDHLMVCQLDEMEDNAGSSDGIHGKYTWHSTCPC